MKPFNQRELGNRDRTRIWYDLMVALIYPSILGAIIYAFLDASIQLSALSFIERMTTLLDPDFIPPTGEGKHFFAAFGITESIGFLVFLVITLLIIVHHSADYLYSKYSEAHYGLLNFVWDTIISFLLAIAYIVLLNGAPKDIHHVKAAFFTFWISMVLTYLIFLWWDFRAYLEFRGSDKRLAQFYLNMVKRFELGGIIIFMILATLSLFITKMDQFSVAYVITCVFVLGVFSVWFCLNVLALENLSTKLRLIAKPQSVPSNKNTGIRKMEIFDIIDCAKIFVDAYQDVYSEIWTIDTASARLLELHESAPNYSFVLITDDAVIGFISARPFSWNDGKRVWLEEIVIEKQYRGKGLGKLLMQTLFRECQSEGIVGFSLLSRIDSSAFKIYRKMGFRVSSWAHVELTLRDDN